MTDKMTLRDSSGQTWSVPIPEHVQVEIAACGAMDALRAALVEAENYLVLCRATCNAMAHARTPSEVQGEFDSSLQVLKMSFGVVDTHAKALITAVSTMLAV